MANIDFTKLLGKKADDAKKPRPLPTGGYICTIEGYEFGTSRQKETPYVRFTLKPMAAREDVDQDALAEAAKEAGLSPQEWMVKKSPRVDFYLTDDAMYRLKDFLENGLGMETTGQTFDKLIPETKNMQVGVNITHQIAQNGEDVYANVDGYFKVE